MGETIGYVVVADGAAMWLGRDGVLWLPTDRMGATVFATRAEARQAIKRSLRYAVEEGMNWRREEYRIQRLVRPS
jgi:hypothetical protein